MALTESVDEIVENSKNPLLGKHDSWGRVRLGEIADIQNGFAFKSSKFNKTAGTPLIRIRDVVKDDTETFYTGEYESEYMVQPGDLLIGMDGDFNCARWRGSPGLLNQRVCRITLTSGVLHPKLLDYALPGYLKAINEKTSSVTVKHLSSKTISQIPLPVPPPEQQEEMVAEIEKQFSHLDEAVASLKRVKVNLKRYKAAVLKAAVEGKLTEEWRKQNPDVEPASKLLERILAERRTKWEEAELAKMKAKGKESKDDKWKDKYKEVVPAAVNELPKISDSWAWATLPELGELNRGKSKHRPRNDSKLYGGAYPFVQTGDVRQAVGILNDYTQTYSKLGLEQSRLWPEGTLCITIAANIADTAILGVEACFPDSVVGFISESAEVDTRYVEYFIRTAKDRLDQFAPATAQKNINLAILSEVALPLPPYLEQCEMVSELQKAESIIDQIQTQINSDELQITRMRSSILNRQFSGN